MSHGCVQIPDTLVIQSHRNPLPHRWLGDCIDSVRNWAALKGFDYRFLGDELFEPLSEQVRHRTREQIVIASDLARLMHLRRALNEGYETVVWCDADFLIFAPERLNLGPEPCGLGREVWIQHGTKGRLKAYVRIHNAFLMFRGANVFLDFYLDTARRLLALNTGRIPPQFIGPKFLSALHNICYLPVEERAAMLSPLVIQDVLGEGDEALALFRERSIRLPAAANLCSSSVERGELSDQQMQALIRHLLSVRTV